MPLLLSMFSNPAMLPGLLAAGLPVLIHLLARRRAREVHFSSLRFLRLSAEHTARRRRLEEIMLLCLRALALGAVALALAGPVLRLGGGLPGRGAVSALVIVDNSLSASQDADGRPALERIREAGADVLEHLPPGSRWAWWLACGQEDTDPLRKLQARPAQQKAQALALVRPTAGAARIADLLGPALRELSGGKTVARELYILSDGQARNWRGLAEATGKPDKAGARIFLYTAQGTGKPNLCLEQTSVSARAPLPGEELKVEVRVRNHSSREASTSLGFYLGGVLARRSRVSVPARGATRVIFNARLARAGWLQGLLQLESDACLLDNRAFFALQVRRAVRVLIVEGDSGPVAHQQPGFYLAAALAPLGTATIKPRRAGAAALEREELARYDAVFLVNLPAPTPAGLASARAYVRGGGTLVLMPGLGVDPRRWGALLGPGSDPHGGLLPCGLAAPRDLHALPGKGLSLAPSETGHPLLAAFAAMARRSLQRVRITRAFALRLPERSAATVAVNLADATPFLVSKRYGQGRVVLWAAPPAPAWGNLQSRPVFVPLVHAHAYLGLGLNRIGSVPAGSPLVLAAPGEPTACAFAVRTPDNGKRLLRAAAADRAHPLLLRDTWKAGIYRVVPASGEARRSATPARLLAVSPASEEGDLSLEDTARVRAGLRGLGPVACVDTITDLAAARARLRRGVDLGCFFLVCALLMLGAEAVYGAGRVKHAGA